MPKKGLSLFVVAHPDDETLFFAGTILQELKRQKNVQVICVTDANADGKGLRRKREFFKACKSLGVTDCEMWDFPDIYEQRLDQNALQKRLIPYIKNATHIFTHGIIGEYGHPHHQDVSYAVSLICKGLKKKLFHCAYNIYPDTRIVLTQKEFALKQKILIKIYGDETGRFLHLLPSTSIEGIIRVSGTALFNEITEIFSFFSKKIYKLKNKNLRRYRSIAKQIQRQKKILLDRPF